jgi:acyl-CoA synthetase (NDP forming)
VTWNDLVDSGIPVPPFQIASTVDQALAFRETYGGSPLCLKAITQAHKARQGLVALNLETSDAVSEAWSRLVALASDLGLPGELLVQKQVPSGLELIIGARRDPVFGPVILLGLGGRVAEVLDRTEVRLGPVARSSALAMTKALLGEELPDVADIVTKVSSILDARPDLDELDLNPVIVNSTGAVAVDLRSITAPPRVTAPDRPFAFDAIARMISPRAVAIVGASNDRTKIGGRVLSTAMEDLGHPPIYVVNPRGGVTQGLPTLTSVDQLPVNVDVVVIAIDAALVDDNLRSCARRGITAAVVLSGGFSEAGDQEAEDRVRDTARSLGIRVCGVNTIGIIGDVPLTFTQATGGEAVSGGVSYVTQSGALGGSLLLRSWATGLGTARYICVGNQTDLAMDDYLAFLAQDDRTTTVGIFLEGIADGRRFKNALAGLRAKGKGVVVMRGGVSEIGKEAARSHTGALAGSAKIYQQVIVESGAVSARDLPELVGICQGLEWLPKSVGRRIGIVSTSGGACSMLADLATSYGLSVPKLEESIQLRLRGALPPFAPTRNPVDTTGKVTTDPHLFGQCAEIVADSLNVDALLVAVTTLTGDSADTIAADLAQLRERTRKPIVLAWTLPESTVASAFRALRAARIPAFDSFDLSMSVLSAAMSRSMASEGVGV